MSYDFAGVYRIHNRIIGRSYIGSASEVNKRWRTHKSQLRRGIHHITDMQNDFVLYGEESFVFSILERVDDKNKLKEREQYYMEQSENLYNLNPSAYDSKGYKFTEEQRKNRSTIFSGEGNPFYGKRHSDEFIVKRRHEMAILTEEQVKEIKQLLQQGDITQKELAKRYNVKPSTISNIKTGKRWSHVTI